MLCVAGAYAAITYSQTVNWNYQPVSESFGVTNADPVNYGTVIGEQTFTRTYTVTNNGNVALTVAASTTGTGFNAVWDKTTATLAAGATDTFTLTLTVNGAGSCTVNINKA